MDVKPVSGKCCFFMKRKTGCLLTIYSLLILQLIFVAHAFYLWITEGTLLKILEGNAVDFSDLLVLSVTILFGVVVSIITTSITVILLIGLHKDDTRLIKFYLISSYIMLLITLSCTVAEYAISVNPIIPVHRIMLFVVSAVFLCVVLKYWMTLVQNNRLYENA